MSSSAPSPQSEFPSLIDAHFQESIRVKALTQEVCKQPLLDAVAMIAESYAKGGKLLLCGNGGSAADAQHLAAEFISTLSATFRRRALPAISLAADTSTLTARANDFHFDEVFSRQVEAFGNPGDVLIGFSTSGNSKNVAKAAEEAKARGVKVISFTGDGGGKLAELSDVLLAVPSGNTQHIQESHIALYHLLCGLVEKSLFHPDGSAR